MSKDKIKKDDILAFLDSKFAKLEQKQSNKRKQKQDLKSVSKPSLS